MFEFVYFTYVCVSLIILLNLLIAMMNDRYTKMKRKAENIWRFDTLLMVTALQRNKMVKILMEPGPWRLGNSSIKSLFCHVFCRYGNDNRSDVIFDKERKRYYLCLMLPDNEKP